MQRVAFVTGVSSGIGYATAALLAERGFRVLGTYRTHRPENLDRTITLLQMSVNDDASVQKAVSAVLADGGRIDVLINNAGYALVGRWKKPVSPRRGISSIPTSSVPCGSHKMFCR